ncbi:MAG: hypothetical protein H7A26_05030 [Spirochaetales bacterium]|nr:hypothetical protein [Spirochaetales bacterium]
MIQDKTNNSDIKLMILKRFFFMILIFLITWNCMISAQETKPGTEALAPASSPSDSSASGAISGTEGLKNGDIRENLPAGFMNITLGMRMEDVKKALTENSWFDYRGDPDVTMLASPNQQLIESRGYSFIEKGYFQFYNEKLFIMTLVFNRERLDFYTMHMLLEGKYGKAARLDPKGAYWENSAVFISLEKPLSIKYMDRNTLDEIAKERKGVEDRGSKNKEEFLNLF